MATTPDKSNPPADRPTTAKPIEIASTDPKASEGKSVEVKQPTSGTAATNAPPRGASQPSGHAAQPAGGAVKTEGQAGANAAHPQVAGHAAQPQAAKAPGSKDGGKPPISKAAAAKADGQAKQQAGASAGGGRGGSKAVDSRGLSSLNESSLERTILRRGLATAEEIESCRMRINKKIGEDDAKALLQMMVDSKVLTNSQAIRLFREAGESQKKFEIPGYEIIDRLGKGSMGMVYKARQTSVDRIVAVKVLLDALASNKEFIKRFEREAKIAAKLSHNNIVNAIDAGEVDGHHYFVMEFVEGKTIKDELDGGLIYDEKEASRIVLAVAEALKHAHQRGLIHRDIKPENIIVTKEGGVKLADLGLARLTADEKWAMAEAGMAIGTPYYISPEQVRGQVDVDIRSDIYSLGASFYHMVTGQVPFSGETPTEVMQKHIDKNLQAIPPDHINTRLSSGSGEVIETMMARNRENRYRDPDDLIIDLNRLLEGEPPIIAAQKLDSLTSLSEGEATDYDDPGGSMSESEMVEMAGYVNSRNNIIAALAVLLGLSIVSNVVMLVSR